MSFQVVFESDERAEAMQVEARLPWLNIAKIASNLVRDLNKTDMLDAGVVGMQATDFAYGVNFASDRADLISVPSFPVPGFHAHTLGSDATPARNAHSHPHRQSENDKPKGYKPKAQASG